MVRFSNQKLMEVLGDDVTQDDFFTRQNQRIAVCVRGLMIGSTQFVDKQFYGMLGDIPQNYLTVAIKLIAACTYVTWADGQFYP